MQQRGHVTTAAPSADVPIERPAVHLRGDWTRYAEPPVEFSPPLILPGGNAPAQRPGTLAAPAPPTEQELRERLAQAIVTKTAAEAVHARAREAAVRATAFKQSCSDSVALFATLDAELQRQLAGALRDGRDTDMPAELREKIAARQQAEADHRLAKVTAEQLGDEAREAREAATAAARAAERIATEVLGHAAVRIAERHDELMAEVARLREQLVAYDRIARGATPQPHVLKVLRSPDLNLMRPVDTSAWTEALHALLADPNAETEI